MVSGVGVTLVNIAVLAIAYPMYLHFLGYEQYGVWLVLSTVLTFAQLGDLGIGPAVMKLVAEEYGRHDLEAAQQYMASAIAVLAVSGAVVLAVILLFRAPIIALFKLSPENARTVSWLLPYMACLSIYVFIVQAVNAALSGFGRMDLANYAQAAGRAVAVLIASSLLFLGAGIKALLIGSAASYIFIHIVSLALIHHIAPIQILRTGNLRLARMKQLLSFGSAVLGGSLLSMLFGPFNKIVLSRYVGVASIPLYEIAFTGSMYVRNLIEAGLRPLMPEISRLNGSTGQHAAEKITRLYRRSTGLILLAGTPVYLILFIFVPPLLQLWLRDRFAEALPWAFRIMLLGTFINLLGVPAYWTLMGKGHVWRNLGAYLVQSTVNLAGVLIILTVSRVTIHGVMIAAATSMAAVPLYLFVQIRHVFRFSEGHVCQARDLREARLSRT
jgi:O-antigen/teichoic acid export membrane protein